MKRDAKLTLRIPRQTLFDIDDIITEDPTCISKNTWILQAINEKIRKFAKQKKIPPLIPDEVDDFFCEKLHLPKRKKDGQSRP